MNRTLASTLGAAALLLGGAAQAQTAPSCEDDVNVGPNRVYIQAADTQVPLLQKLGALLRAQTPAITLVYSPAGSCANIGYLYNGADFTPNASGGGTFYIPDGYDPTTPAPTCTPATAPAVKPNLAISIIFPTMDNCPMIPAQPSTVQVTTGPVQAMVFAVPGGVGTGAGSSQTTITDEEAYLVLGLGAMNAMVEPWSTEDFIYGRTVTKGTQVSIGANIGVAAAKWQLEKANEIDQSNAVATAIAAQTTTGNAEQTLGILGAEVYDPARAMVHALAFRARGQYKSYWPDSTPTATDKQNVRDGHYPLWSYVQYLAPLDATTGMVEPNTQKLINLMAGVPTETNPPFEPLDQVVASGLVPACAMHVSRSVEGGAEALFSSSEPCDCYYDSKVATTQCTACTDDSACGAGKCRHGYCEAK